MIGEPVSGRVQHRKEHRKDLGRGSKYSSQRMNLMRIGGDTDEADCATERKRETNGYDFLNHCDNTSLIFFFCLCFSCPFKILSNASSRMKALVSTLPG